MKKIFIAVILLVSTVNYSQHYVKASDILTQSTIVVPDEVIHPDYSLENGKAYQGDTIIVLSRYDLQFKGFKSQEIIKETQLRYSQKQKKNVTTEVVRPLSAMTVSWTLIVSIFLYCSIFGYWILKSKDSVIVGVAAALVAAVPAALVAAVPAALVAAVPAALAAALAAVLAASILVDIKIFKILFFLLTLVAMGIVSYSYETTLFIVCCALGLGLALLMRNREINLSKPEIF